MSPTPGRTVSIADVARLAEVSAMTVSRVINDKGPVGAHTRERVLAAMQRLSYRPNVAAQALSTGRSKVIGVVTLQGTVDGPTSTLAGIEQDARAQGYSVAVSILQNATPESIAAAVADLRAQAVAGIVLSAPHTGLDDSLVPPSAVPMVAVEGLAGRIPIVAVDQKRGAELATEHLLELGHRTIAHIAGPRNRLEALEREAGWRSALRAAHAKPGPLVRGDWSARSGYQLGRRLLERPDVTAVFVANDQMALGLLRLLAERDVAVPDQMSVVGFDDIPEAAYLVPALSTVQYDFYDLGRRTLGRLMTDIVGLDGTPGPQRIVMDPSLVPRESSGRRPT